MIEVRKLLIEDNDINVEFCRNVFVDMMNFGIYNIQKGKEGKNEWYK